MGPSELVRAAAIMLSSVMIGVQTSEFLLEKSPLSPTEGTESPQPLKTAAVIPRPIILKTAGSNRLI
jgi:hypothetical protein